MTTQHGSSAIDYEAIRQKVSEMGEAWDAKYGNASWNAALVVMGVLPPSTPVDAIAASTTIV